MQHVVTGLTPDGRSTVIEWRTVPTPAAGQVGVDTICSTAELPPRVPESLVAQPAAIDIGVPQAGSSWLVVQWPADAEAFFHRSDTLDYDVVVSGQVTLLLEEGEVELHAGDSVVIPGVLHGWRAGPEGAVCFVVVLGLAEPGHRPETATRTPR